MSHQQTPRTLREAVEARRDEHLRRAESTTCVQVRNWSEDEADELTDALANQDGPMVCHICGKPATCWGSYEGGPWAYACDDYCGHGNEDGKCQPVAQPDDDRTRSVVRDIPGCPVSARCVLEGCRDFERPTAAELAKPDAGEGLSRCSFCGNAPTPPAALCTDDLNACICQACIANAVTFFRIPIKATPADTIAQSEERSLPNVRLFTKEGVFYLYGMGASGNGDSPEAAMRAWTRHRNTHEGDQWPVSPADTPPALTAKDRERIVRMAETNADWHRSFGRADEAEAYAALATKCRAHAERTT